MVRRLTLMGSPVPLAEQIAHRAFRRVARDWEVLGDPLNEVRRLAVAELLARYHPAGQAPTLSPAREGAPAAWAAVAAELDPLSPADRVAAGAPRVRRARRRRRRRTAAGAAAGAASRGPAGRPRDGDPVRRRGRRRRPGQPAHLGPRDPAGRRRGRPRAHAGPLAAAHADAPGQAVGGRRGRGVRRPRPAQPDGGQRPPHTLDPRPGGAGRARPERRGGARRDAGSGAVELPRDRSGDRSGRYRAARGGRDRPGAGGSGAGHRPAGAGGPAPGWPGRPDHRPPRVGCGARVRVARAGSATSTAGTISRSR